MLPRKYLKLLLIFFFWNLWYLFMKTIHKGTINDLKLNFNKIVKIFLRSLTSKVRINTANEMFIVLWKHDLNFLKEIPLNVPR